MELTQLEHKVLGHEIWFKDPSQGHRLELRNESLAGVDLSGRHLLDARFTNVDFTAAIGLPVLMQDCAVEQIDFSPTADGSDIRTPDLFGRATIST